MRSRGPGPNKVKPQFFVVVRMRARALDTQAVARMWGWEEVGSSRAARVHVTKFKSGGAIVMRDASARFRCLAAKIRGRPRVRQHRRRRRLLHRMRHHGETTYCRDIQRDVRPFRFFQGESSLRILFFSFFSFFQKTKECIQRYERASRVSNPNLIPSAYYYRAVKRKREVRIG